MSGYQWGLAYLAVGAAIMAWRWHSTNMDGFVGELRELLGKQGFPPGLVVPGMVLAGVLASALWPLVLGVILVQRSRRSDDD